MAVAYMSNQKYDDLLARARALNASRLGARGLGDVVATALKLPGVAGVVKALTGIDPHKPCDGCERRRAWLNEKVHWGKRVNDNV